MNIYKLLLEKMDVSDSYIKQLAHETRAYNKHYRTFYISKGKKANKRRIDSPLTILKSVQHALKEVFEENFAFPDYVQGFVKDRSFITNATLHLGKPFMLSVDITDFFPSIKESHILDFFEKYTVTSNPEVVVKLLTYNDHLPQGSPVSPIIANLMFKEYDERLYLFCCENGFTYTRYADDITISSDSDNLHLALKFINRCMKKSPFFLNRAKTNFSSVNKRQEVTGIVINPDHNGISRLKMNKRWRKNIRAGFFNAHKAPFKNRHKYDHLSGCLNLLKQLDTVNGESNSTDRELISIGKKSLKKLKPFMLFNRIENFMKKN